MTNERNNASSNKGWLQRILNQKKEPQKQKSDPLDESLSKSTASHDSYKSSISMNSNQSNLEAKGKHSEQYIIAQETQDDALRAFGGV